MYRQIMLKQHTNTDQLQHTLLRCAACWVCLAGSIQDFWAVHSASVGCFLLELGIALQFELDGLDFTTEELAQVAAVLQPQWAPALLGATADELNSTIINYIQQVQ